MEKIASVYGAYSVDSTTNVQSFGGEDNLPTTMSDDYKKELNIKILREI